MSRGSAEEELWLPQLQEEGTLVQVLSDHDETQSRKNKSDE